MSARYRQRLKRRREKLWKTDPRCVYCGRVTNLHAKKDHVGHFIYDPLLATLDHLNDRWVEYLGDRHDGDGAKTVLACFECNNKRQLERSKKVGIKILRQRAHAGRAKKCFGAVVRGASANYGLEY